MVNIVDQVIDGKIEKKERKEERILVRSLRTGLSPNYIPKRGLSSFAPANLHCSMFCLIAWMTSGKLGSFPRKMQLFLSFQISHVISIIIVLIPFLKSLFAPLMMAWAAAVEWPKPCWITPRELQPAQASTRRQISLEKGLCHIRCTEVSRFLMQRGQK